MEASHLKPRSLLPQQSSASVFIISILSLLVALTWAVETGTAHGYTQAQLRQQRLRALKARQQEIQRQRARQLQLMKQQRARQERILRERAARQRQLQLERARKQEIQRQKARQRQLAEQQRARQLQRLKQERARQEQILRQRAARQEQMKREQARRQDNVNFAPSPRGSLANSPIVGTLDLSSSGRGSKKNDTPAGQRKAGWRGIPYHPGPVVRDPLNRVPPGLRRRGVPPDTLRRAFSPDPRSRETTMRADPRSTGSVRHVSKPSSPPSTQESSTPSGLPVVLSPGGDLNMPDAPISADGSQPSHDTSNAQVRDRSIQIAPDRLTREPPGPRLQGVPPDELRESFWFDPTSRETTMTAAPRAPSGPTGYLKGEDEVQNDWRQLYGPHAVEIPGIPSHPTLIPTPNIEEAKRLVKDHGPGIAIKAINPALKPAYDVSKALYSAYGEYSRSGSLMNGVVEFETKLFFSKFAGDTTKAVTGNKILQVPVGVLVKELIKPIKAADKNSSTESIARGVREMVPNVGELITKR